MMRGKKKRRIAAVLVTVLLVLCLAGCGKKSETIDGLIP